MQLQRLVAVLALAGAVGLSGCGGGNKASNNGNTTQSSQAAGSAASQGAAMAGRPMAPIPSTLHCGAVKPVWVNERRHNYREAGDPYYGRTRYGKYMCPSAAVAAGYHRAGGGGAMGGSMRSYGKHHHRGGAMAPASPGANPAYSP